MHIQIITVGKIKENYIKQGIKQFEKRLRPYCKLAFAEVNDEQAPEELSNKELNLIKQIEGERILKKVKPNHYVIALDINGESWSSKQFAKEMELLGIEGKSRVSFVIGGSNGLSADVLNRADQILSFSKMTFPHQLMKLILLEQIYRGYKIQKNEPYHK